MLVEPGESLSSVLGAAALWRDRALLGDQAMFSEESIWKMDNLRALWVALTAESGDCRKLETLGERLRGTQPAVVRLAAELLWVMYLAPGPTCISHSRKIELIKTVYDWSGESLSVRHQLLQDALAGGAGDPGLFFNARRSEELSFLIKAVVGVKKRSNAERSSLMDSPWDFASMLDDAAGSEIPQLSHMLRYLLFPIEFEPIFNKRDKRRITESFSGIPRKETRRWSVTQLDEELANIQKQLTPLYESETLSFFQEPLISTWRHGGARNNRPSSERRFWVEKSDVQGRPDRQTGEHRLGTALWSRRQSSPDDNTAAFMREVEEGDVIFHFTDNTGITGVSVATGEIDEEFTCLEGTEFSGQRGYRIALVEFTEVTPMLGQNTLFLGPQFQDELRHLAEAHGSLFFNRQLTLNRDHYLSEAPDALVRIFDDAYRAASNRHLPHVLLPEIEDLPESSQASYRDGIEHPLAQIFYGTTGTGKTYNAIVRAVEICDEQAPGNHYDLMIRYHELQAANRIRLITFHPTYSYKDFIEGPPSDIDPRQESGDDAEGEVEAEIELCRPGVFKTMAESARLADVAQESPPVDLLTHAVWKISLGTDDDGGRPDAETMYRDLLEGGFISLPEGGSFDFSNCDSRESICTALERMAPGVKESDEAVSTIHQLTNLINAGDLIVLTNTDTNYLAIGRISGGYQHQQSVSQRIYFQTRSVDWLTAHDDSQPWHRISRKQFLSRSLYRLDTSLLRLDELTSLISEDSNGPENYVLIIDEIGRGDVSRIFGELVTLIEPDKRTGASNALCVQLPLSGENFGVPGNLYLIGTLNPADPISATTADILHRRFEFEEMLPDISLITGDDQLGTIPDSEDDRIDLRALMLTINKRIEFLAGNQHQLGQAFFMHIRSYDNLLHTIRSRILPRLQQLFEGDWRKIQLIFKDVLADGQPNAPQLIAHERLCSASVLGFDHTELEEQVRYWVPSDQDLIPDTFRKVYSDL